MRVLRPKTAAEAVEIYAREPGALPFAGGTDLMVAWNAGTLNGRTLLDISRVAEWKGIRATPEGLVFGALATHAELRDHPLVRRGFPLLSRACAVIGAIQIQNRGTLGGNIANASPAGDTFPPLAVYRARVRLVSRAGQRTMPLLDIFAGPKKTTLKPAELVAAVELPALERRPARQLFRKVGARAAQAISKVVGAGLLFRNKDGTIAELRFALGSVAPTVRRLTGVEELARGKDPTEALAAAACALLRRDIAPIDDLRSTREYRLRVSENLLRSFLLG